MGKIKYLLLMILLIPTVFASTPQFSVNYLFENEVINGNIDIGDILFLKQPYQSDVIQRQTISNFTLQEYDVLKWMGNESIKVRNPQLSESILVAGSEYYFSSDGLYQIFSMLNNSDMAYITVIDSKPNTINITEVNVPIGMSLVFSNTSFLLENEKTIGLTLDIDDDVMYGDYALSFKINNISKSHQFKVLRNFNWTINDTNLTKNIIIKNGESKYLGRIELINNGNMDVEITTTKYGNDSHMIGIPQPQTLYRKNQLFIDIQAQVPTIQLPGNYTLNIRMDGGNITQNVSLNVTVQDSILPSIDQVNFSSDRVFVNNNITVIATDNNDVKSVILYFDDKNVVLKKDGNIFTGSYLFDKLSQYNMQLCAEDIEKNKVCEDINRTFIKLKVIEGHNKSIQMPSVKFAKYSSKFLINLSVDVPEGISLQLVSFEGNTQINNTALIRVVDEDGSIKQFTQFTNDVKIFDKGTYTIEVRSDIEGDFEGLLRFDVPEYIESVQDTTFRVSFKNYDVPLDFTQEWIDGRQFECKVIDTGDLDSSYFNCEITYPISLKAGTLSVPTTNEERQKFKDEANLVREELAKNKRKQAWIISILILVPIIILLWGLYMVLIYPTLRVRGRESRK